MSSIQPVKVNHLNMIMDDFDTTIGHFRNIYDAEFILGMRNVSRVADHTALPKRDALAALRGDHRAALFSFGGVIFQQFVPEDFFLYARPGRVWHGLEYQVDMAAARAAITERGIRLASDLGVSFLTDARDSYGVAIECFGGEFHQRSYDLLGGKGLRPAAYWADEHPLGLTGLKGFTIAVPTDELEEAERLFTGLLGGRRIYGGARPAIAARAIGLQVADSFVELLAPTGDGTVRRQLETVGPGIYSAVLGVGDLEKARGYMAGKGIALGAGTSVERLAAPAAANLDLVFEYQR